MPDLATTYPTVTHDGVTVESNTGTQAELRADLGLPEDDAAAETETAETAEASETDEGATPEPQAAPTRDAKGQFAAKPKEAASAVEAKPKAGNPRHDPQARFNELTREKGEAVRRAEAAEAELARLRAPKSADDPARQPAAKPEKFTYETFEQWAAKAENADRTYDEYHDDRDAARDEFKDRQRQRQAAEQQAQSTWQTYADRRAAYAAEHPDFEERIQRSPITKMPAPPYVVEAVVTSEQAPALQDYFLQHPDVYQRILALSPAAAVREIGKIEERLTAANSGPASALKPAITAAKPLIKPVSGSPSVTDEPVGDEGNDDDWLQDQRKRDAQKRAARR